MALAWRRSCAERIGRCSRLSWLCRATCTSASRRRKASRASTPWASRAIGVATPVDVRLGEIGVVVPVPARRSAAAARPRAGSNASGAMAVKRYVMLCEGEFDEDAKTATGVMRYADAVTVAVIDSTRAGLTSADAIPGMTDRVPIVATLAETLGDRSRHAADRRRAGRREAAAVVSGGGEGGARAGSGRRERPARLSRRRSRAGAAAVAGGSEIRDLRRPPTD